MGIRIVFSLMVTGLYMAFVAFYNPIATVMSGSVAGRQFENNDVTAVTTQMQMNFLSGVSGIAALILFLILLAIWWTPMKDFMKYLAASSLAIALLIGMPSKSEAFFEKADRTEALTILPNESAFWIPDTGANKDNQVQLDSEAYLNNNKVATKRYVIPHQKLGGSGGWSSWDYYVPSGRLIIVDRTPYSREWVDAHDRGTSKFKEGFPCQSKEGLNITVGVSIGTSVTEAESAKYLYNFGVLPPKGDRTAGEIIFTSVYYSRSVKDVMDDVGRKMVQTLVCEEITSRSFDDNNAQANQIMETVKKKSEAYFKSVGITLNFIGWADTFSFDNDVQLAVNRKYIAKQDQAVAMALAPYAETIRALAAADALRNFGMKSDGKLPTTIVGLPTELGSLLGTVLSSPMAHPVTQAPATPPPAPATGGGK